MVAESEDHHSELTGVLIEIFIADLLTVLGLAGQKYALMQSRLERCESLLSLGQDDDAYRELRTHTPDISFFSSERQNNNDEIDEVENRTHSTTSTHTQSVVENESDFFYNISDHDYDQDVCSETSRGIEFQTFTTGNASRKLSCFKDRSMTIGDVTNEGCFSMSKHSTYLWIAAFAVYVVGQASEAVALSLASQTDVVSVSNLAIFWNGIIAVYLFNEKFTFLPTYRECSFRVLFRWDLLSYGLLMAGSSIAVIYTPLPPDDKSITADMYMDMWTEQPYCYFALFLLVCLAILSIITVSNWGNKVTGNLNGTLLACITSILSAFTITLSKVVMTLLKKVLMGQHDYGIISTTVMALIWVFLLISSIALLNLALSHYEQGLIIPIYEVVGTLLQLVSGILYYKTYYKFSSHDWHGFSLGVVLMCWGIWLTAHREPRTDEDLDHAFVSYSSNGHSRSRSNSPEGQLHEYIPTLLSNQQLMEE
mmetsp:Transcript_6887/g.8358  ORF Transcript_6887/g.8358 Transcript_6887/m.8358 type:complete len:481 (-) Transcript_6887:334-1776(-)